MKSKRPVLERLTTGSPAFDGILGGGLPARSLNVIAGEPGAGMLPSDPGRMKLRLPGGSSLFSRKQAKVFSPANTISPPMTANSGVFSGNSQSMPVWPS